MRMTSKEKEAIASEITSYLEHDAFPSAKVEELLGEISRFVLPEDMFSDNELGDWAIKNGYVPE